MEFASKDFTFVETIEYQQYGMVDIKCPECGGTMKFPIWFDKGVFKCPKCGVFLAYVTRSKGLRLVSMGIYE